MVAELAEIGLRIKGLREACDVSREDMAAELEVPLETYARWEETGDDVPISAIYHMAHHFGVEFTEILTGTAAKLDTYQVVRWGEGREVDRYPGYHFEDLAWRYTGKIMQPLLVVLDPSDELVRELQNHVKHTTAPYKYPRIVEFVDELPKTIGGKIKRKLIRNNDGIED